MHSALARTLGYSLRAMNGANKLAARVALARMAQRSRCSLRLDRVGDGDGAWTVPPSLLKPDGIAYCVGVGWNASFDRKLATDYGMRVLSLDPTPNAIEHMKTFERDASRHKFLPMGVWKDDTVLRFYMPMNFSENLSARDIHGTGRFIEAPVKPLSKIMEKQGHDHLDLLKIDVEGAWFEVIEDICASNIPLSVFCAEFDTPTTPWKARRAVQMLERQGLTPVHAERDNLLFVDRKLLQ